MKLNHKNILILLIVLLAITFKSNAQSTNSRHTGIYYITEFGYLSTSNNYVNHAFRLRTIFGHFITPKISTGIGLGLDGYHDPSDINTAPLFLDVRGYILDEPKTLFTFLNLGKSVELFDGQEKGFFTNFGIGYQKNKLLVSIGYNRQIIEDINGNITITSTAFNLGLLF
jgi:hypothetical protein